MAHQSIDMRCPGCGAPVSTDQTICNYCYRPIIISTFNSVNSMSLPEVNKYAGSYRSALAKYPDNTELNNSIAMCYLKLKLYDKAQAAFAKAIEDCKRNDGRRDAIRFSLVAFSAKKLSKASYIGGRKTS